MSYELVNTPRSKTVLRITGNSPVLVKLSDLSTSNNEIVKGATITQASCVSDGIWRVFRGDNASGEKVLELTTFAHFQFYEFDVTIANNASSNIYVTNSGTAGTMIIQLSKDCIYTPPLNL